MTIQLEEQWIVGFVDGEGCFNLDVHRKSDMRWGLQMQPEFTVVQNEVDIELLRAFIDYFGCGSIGVNRRDENGTRYHYRVKNVKDLNEKIITFFDEHSFVFFCDFTHKPLMASRVKSQKKTKKTKKNVEYQRFRRICILMMQGYHRESLKNFLEVYDLGVALRVRSRPRRTNARSRKIKQIIFNLREKLKNEDFHVD